MPSIFGRRPDTARLPVRTTDRSGRPVTVRPAVANDALEYQAHMRRIVTETHYMLQCDFDPMPPVESQRRLLTQLQRSDNSLALVAYRPNAARGLRIVGSVTLLGGRSSRTRHACTLGMGVDRNDWGLGLGGLLLDAAVAWARANPLLGRVGLQVFTDNAAALHLYESRGFAHEGTMQHEVLIGPGYEPLVGMALEVWSPDAAPDGEPS